MGESATGYQNTDQYGHRGQSRAIVVVRVKQRNNGVRVFFWVEDIELSTANYIQFLDFKYLLYFGRYITIKLRDLASF